MPFDKKYGRVELEDQRSIGDDEPVVVFRAKDLLLPRLLVIYWSLCQMEGSPENHLDAIADTRQTILKWQDENGAQVPTSLGYFPEEKHGV